MSLPPVRTTGIGNAAAQVGAARASAGPRAGATGCLVALAALICCGPAAAQGFVPYATFQSRAPENLARLQVRLLYLGPPQRPLPSIALCLPGDTLDRDLPGRYRRRGFKYPGPATRLVACPVTPGELKAALDSVATLPAVVDGGVDSLALFSFALVDTTRGGGWFETILNETSGLELVTQLGRALRDNARASAALSAIGCGLRVMPAEPEGEVTRLLAVTLAGISNDPVSRRVTARLRVVNVSRDTIPGPLVVVLSTRPESVALLDADGTTCRVFDPGCPFVVVPLDRPLAPGAAVEHAVRFENPRQRNFGITPRVFVGLADR